MAKERIRTQGMLIFLGVVLAIVFSGRIVRWDILGPADDTVEIIGFILFFLGFIFRIAARGYKQENSRQGRTLVVSGPYRYVRNPMYFGTLLIGCGVSAVILQIWTLPVFLIVYCAIYFPQVAKEEKLLLQEFGEEYKNYCLQTPAYFPKVICLTQIKRCLAVKTEWIKKEQVSFILVFLFLAAIETWEDVSCNGWAEAKKEFLIFALIFAVYILVLRYLTTKGGKNDIN